MLNRSAGGSSLSAAAARLGLAAAGFPRMAVAAWTKSLAASELAELVGAWGSQPRLRRGPKLWDIRFICPRACISDNLGCHGLAVPPKPLPPLLQLEPRNQFMPCRSCDPCSMAGLLHILEFWGRLGRSYAPFGPSWAALEVLFGYLFLFAGRIRPSRLS